MFRDRVDAGEQLAKLLNEYKSNQDVVVLAIPRGGLVLGDVIAQYLKVPLDVIFAKKIPAPGNPELAIGAVTFDSLVTSPYYSVDKTYLEQQIRRLREMLSAKDLNYHEKKKREDLAKKIVILVDDGLATGYTMFAAIKYVKKFDPKKIIVALPISSNEGYEELNRMADQVICLQITSDFQSVSQFYHNFPQLTDEEAIRLLSGGL